MTQIIVPGFQGSPKGHWQYWLQEISANAITVQQDDWFNPEVNAWVDRLQETVDSTSGPIQLVGHSMGAITIALWAEKYDTSRIDSAVLVAPADTESDYLPKEIEGFAPIPTVRLPFPTTLIGSHNDPYMSFVRVIHFANVWDTAFIDAGFVGHINKDSGFGQWPELLPILENAHRANHISKPLLRSTATA